MSTLREYYEQCAISKGEPSQKTKRREDRKHADRVSDVRVYVFARDRDLCRCCRIRPAQSMHEIKPKSLGGKISRKNSIAVCGHLVGTEECCHTYLQQRIVSIGHSILGAEAELIFTPENRASADWLRIALGEQIVSPPMVQLETE